MISIRAYNDFGKGPVIYDLIYTRDRTQEGGTGGKSNYHIGLLMLMISHHFALCVTVFTKYGVSSSVSAGSLELCNAGPGL